MQMTSCGLLMKPGSIISFFNDTHYAIIRGGSYEYTPVTLLAEYQSKTLEKQICELNQITNVKAVEIK